MSSTGARLSISETDPVRLGKFPYPYEAAFAVASDIDSASIARFEAIHALFCEQEIIPPDTPRGHTLGIDRDYPRDHVGRRGLGLDFADSFFLVGDKTTFGLYRHCPDTNCFQDEQEEKRDCGSLIWQALKQGSIDSFHSFLHHTRRQLAPLLQQFFEGCEREGVPKPKVWTNHSLAVTPTGLCPRRLQPNPISRLMRLSARKLIGPLFGRARLPLRFAFARYQGDRPGSAYYINDILAANGLRYVWLNMGDLHRNQIVLPEHQMNGRPTILKPVAMDDGVRYYRFDRCYGKPVGRFGSEAYLRDSESGFDASVLITTANLEELCRSEGTCILYVHWTHPRSFPVPSATFARFELLRRWRDAGKIWVTSTSKLLEWTRRRTFLKVVSRREGKRLVVELPGVEDPLFGYEPTSLNDLDGLCWRLPLAGQDITVVVQGSALEPHQVHRSGNLCWLDTRGDLTESLRKAAGALHIETR